MRFVVPFALLLVGCTLDWDRLDPALASSQGGAGGTGGSQAATGGGGAGGCADDTVMCDGTCVDVAVDLEHCGNCTTSCADTEICASGACQPAPSCRALLDAHPTLADGVYPLAPGGGVEPFEAHCDMSTEGGGWTLVASAADNSYFNGITCETTCGMDPPIGCSEEPFTEDVVVGDVATMLVVDHKSPAFGAVPFDEMLFVDSNDNYVSYDVTGESVLAWYPVGLENWVAEGTEAHPTFSYPAKASNLDASDNVCGTLRVSFNVEDSDSLIGGTCHTSFKGPAWSDMTNGACFWDDAGVSWTYSAFYRGNTTSYQLWLVR